MANLINVCSATISVLEHGRVAVGAEGLLIEHPATGSYAVIDSVEIHDGETMILAKLDGISDYWGIGMIEVWVDRATADFRWKFAFGEHGRPICPVCRVNECEFDGDAEGSRCCGSCSRRGLSSRLPGQTTPEYRAAAARLN